MIAHQELSGQLGRYSIVSKLGAGGMGAVYLADDTKLGRRVALKVPHVSANEDAVIERFRREARLAAGINHANLCPVFDVDEANGILFFTMPYIEGTPLSRLIERGKPWPVTQAIELIKKLGAAVGHLHACGIIHRDLKPGNVMIRPTGEPVLMDFGLARSFTARTKVLTALGQPLGSPAYMAPEQVAGASRMGPATDVYGLGIILYELLAAQLPFEGPVEAVFHQILSVAPPPPSSICAGLNPRLDDVILKALSKRLEQRQASVSALISELSALSPPPALPVATLLPNPGPTNRLAVATQQSPSMLPTVAPGQTYTADAVRVECPHCRQRAQVPASLAGRKVKCPNCGANLGQLPAALTPPAPHQTVRESSPANPNDFSALTAAVGHDSQPSSSGALKPVWLSVVLLVLVVGSVAGVYLSRKDVDSNPPGSDPSEQDCITLRTLHRNLRAKDPNTRIDAMCKLAKFGEKAKGGSETIVEAMLVKDSEIREAASDALEKIDPAIHKDVVTLLFGQDKPGAATRLMNMGKEAKSSLPALLHVYQSIKHNETVEMGERRGSNFGQAGGLQFGVGGGAAGLVKGGTSGGGQIGQSGGGSPGNGQFGVNYATVPLRVLVTIGPDDQRVCKLVLSEIAAQPVLQRGLSRRYHALQVLDSVQAETKDKVKALITALEDGDRAVEVIQALGKLGRGADAAMPVLKKLKRSPNDAIREAATNALKQIE